jgi:hypothetical protein
VKTHGVLNGVKDVTKKFFSDFFNTLGIVKKIQVFLDRHPASPGMNRVYACRHQFFAANQAQTSADLEMAVRSRGRDLSLDFSKFQGAGEGRGVKGRADGLKSSCLPLKRLFLSKAGSSAASS